MPEPPARFEPALAGEPFAYLTTKGLKTGLAREIEIWFALGDEGATVYVMAGAPTGARWIGNLRADPAGSVRIAGEQRAVRAEILGEPSPEDAHARERLRAKYAMTGRTLERWAAGGLPVALRVS